MADPIDKPGGRFLWNTNQRIDSADMTTMGGIAIQSLTALLSKLLEDGANNQAHQGFIEDDCNPAGAGGLTFGLLAGIGLVIDSAEADPFEPIYKIVPLPTGAAGAVGAHDPVNPRIDVLSLKPATVDEESETRQIFDGIGSFNPTTVETLRRLSATVTVTAGVPSATPVVPAFPANEIPIAVIEVPATAGDITVHDARPIINVNRDAVVPGVAFVENFVPGSGGELLVTNAVGQGVVVALGEAVVQGAQRRYRKVFESEAVYGGDNASADPRLDTIVAQDDGTIAVLVGAPAPSPIAPLPPPNTAILATALIPGLASDYTVITDNRKRQPYGDNQLRDNAVPTRVLQADSVTAAKLNFDIVIPELTPGSESGEEFTVIITSKDSNGAQIGRVIRYVAELFNNNIDRINEGANWHLDIAGGGTRISGDTGENGGVVFDTGSDGIAVVGVNDLPPPITATVWLRVMPLNEPGNAAMVPMTFNV